MLNRQTVSQIWDLFGKAEVDLFASQESYQCPLWFSLSFPTTLGIDAFAHPWPNVILYAFPPIELIPAVLCRVKVSSARLFLIAPFWPFASSEDERLHTLCPVRALKLYVDHSKVWRKTSQLLVCFGVGRHGLATSKQSISHWVRDAISLAYEVQNLPSPLSLRAHSTRGVASSQALFRGVPLEDICVAAGWSSPHTFVKFYNLDIDTAPGSQILSV